jgi:6-phosphogluconolactonase
MKLKNIGRAALATALSLGIGLGATACSRDYTVAYVYAISKANNAISAFAVDYQSGALTQINGSPFAGSSTTGVPVAVVASPSGKFIYMVNNLASSISVYAVGTDGKLYGQQTPSTVGSYPTAAAIDTTGCFLYTTVKLQTGYTTAAPGKGAVDVFPIISSACGNGTPSTTNPEGNLGTPTVVPVGNNPVSVTVSQPYCYSGTGAVTTNATCNSGAGKYVVYAYVLDQENEATPALAATPNTPSTAAPNILGFSQNMTTGALTALSGTACNTVAGSACTGYAAGVGPSSIGVEPTSRFVYVTDALTNQILSYQIGSNTNGNLVGLVSSPTATGLYPNNLTIDPRGKFLLTANYNSATIGSYTINAANGSLGGVAGTSAATTGTGPSCVTIEPALGIYVYTSNLIDGTVTGEQMNASTGALTGIVNTPFPPSTLPSCIVAVANGSHAQSIVNP